MKIGFQRSGGFAGMVMSKEIDADNLPPNEANQLRQLIDAADFFRLPAQIISRGPQPDRFQYQISVEKDGQQHTVEVGEQSVPGTLRPLLDWMMTALRQR